MLRVCVIYLLVEAQREVAGISIVHLILLIEVQGWRIREVDLFLLIKAESLVTGISVVDLMIEAQGFMFWVGVIHLLL